MTYVYFVSARNSVGASPLSSPATGYATPAPLTITTSGFFAWTVNIAGYSQQIAASGGVGADTFAITAGNLPFGLSLNNTSGAVSGAPTTPGTFAFTVTVTDSLRAQFSKNFAVTINPALSITTTTLPNGTATAGYNQQIVAAGGTGPDSFTVIAGGPPPGLRLDSATGIIAGAPLMSGTFSFTIAATDSIGVQTKRSYSVTINSPSVGSSPFTTTIWIKSQWGGIGPGSGFDAQVHVVNTSTTAFSSVEMTFDFPAQWSYEWGTQVISVVNNHYSIRLNGGIGSLGSTDFGFVAGPVLSGPLHLYNLNFVATPVTTPPPVSASTLVATSWSKSTWYGGADIQVHIDNSSSQSYSAITISFDLAGDITSTWGIKTMIRNGNHYVLTLSGGVGPFSGVDFGFVVRSSSPGPFQVLSTNVIGVS